MEFAAQLHQQNLLEGRIFFGYFTEILACFFPSCTRSEHDGSWCVRHHYQRFKEHENKAEGQVIHKGGSGSRQERVLLLEVWLGHTLSVKEQYKCMVWLHMVPLQNEGLCGYCTIVFICVGNICCNFSYGLLKKVRCQILRSFSDKNSLMFSNKAMWVRKGCLDWKS